MRTRARARVLGRWVYPCYVDNGEARPHACVRERHGDTETQREGACACERARARACVRDQREELMRLLPAILHANITIHPDNFW